MHQCPAALQDCCTVLAMHPPAPPSDPAWSSPHLRSSTHLRLAAAVLAVQLGDGPRLQPPAQDVIKRGAAGADHEQLGALLKDLLCSGEAARDDLLGCSQMAQ